MLVVPFEENSVAIAPGTGDEIRELQAIQIQGLSEFSCHDPYLDFCVPKPKTQSRSRTAGRRCRRSRHPGGRRKAVAVAGEGGDTTRSASVCL